MDAMKPHNEKCLNPLCGNSVEPKKKHAPVKHYCCAECTQTASILRRANKLLAELSDEQKLKVLR
jgi:hypothetical protein